MSSAPSILVIDDDREVCTFFQRLLAAKGHTVAVARTGAEAMEAIDRTRFDLALVDLKLPDTDGLQLLRRIKAVHPLCEVIIMTGYSTVKSAVEAIQLGAYDYIEKPFEVLEELEALISRALDLESRRDDWARTDARFGFVVGRSFAMRRVIAAAEKIARKNITVLLAGETGTGKEVMARFVHAASHRANQPFIAVNCAAFTETLLESELFGHEKGSFTGAAGLRRGIFEVADHGTLLLDEVGSASLAIQARLLRVLETGEFLRVGGEYVVRTDVRVIAATNIDLHEAVRQGRFREDLLYRLDVASLHLPPLRERRDDIPILANYFLARQMSAERVGAGAEDGEVPRRLSPETMELLKEYHWPGNIRELANVIAQVTALADGPTILPRHMPPKITGQGDQAWDLAAPGVAAPGGGGAAPPAGDAPVVPAAETAALPAAAEVPGISARLDGARAGLGARLDAGQTVSLDALLHELTSASAALVKDLIHHALRHTLGDRRAAARLLGITPRALRYLYREKGERKTPPR